MRHRSNATKVHFSTLQEAIGGDTIALNKIIKNYERYIIKLSIKRYLDAYGNVITCIDEDIKRQLETKLIIKILGFKLY